jgi:hypothetical protein
MLVDALYDPRTGSIDQDPLDPLPDAPHDRDEPFGCLGGIEIQIDQHVIRVVDRAIHAIPAHARTLAPRWIAVESSTPIGVVADWVLDLDGYHDRTSLVIVDSMSARDAPDHLAPAMQQTPRYP